MTERENVSEKVSSAAGMVAGSAGKRKAKVTPRQPLFPSHLLLLELPRAALRVADQPLSPEPSQGTSGRGAGPSSPVRTPPGFSPHPAARVLPTHRPSSPSRPLCPWLSQCRAGRPTLRPAAHRERGSETPGMAPRPHFRVSPLQPPRQDG